MLQVVGVKVNLLIHELMLLSLELEEALHPICKELSRDVVIKYSCK